MEVQSVDMWALVEWNKTKKEWEITGVSSDLSFLESSFNWSVGFFGIAAKIIRVEVNPKLDKQGRKIVKKSV